MSLKEVEKNPADVGVIVARVQTPFLTQGHLDLLNTVFEKHEKNIVILGIGAIGMSKRNPLDFESRKQMIVDAYPEAIVMCIRDIGNNAQWSKNVDCIIENVTNPVQTIALYGSRDSFIKHYSGKYRTIELQPETVISATEIRKEIIKKAKNTIDFRAGMIYSSLSRYDNPKATIDVAIFNEAGNKILLGRKETETKLRFIGGFIDCNETAEQAVARETFEETNTVIANIQYISSVVIDDWRYRAEIENILTFFYKATYVSGNIEPKDDIVEVCWKELDTLTKDDIVATHEPLFNLIKGDKS